MNNETNNITGTIPSNVNTNSNVNSTPVSPTVQPQQANMMTGTNKDETVSNTVPPVTQPQPSTTVNTMNNFNKDETVANTNQYSTVANVVSPTAQPQQTSTVNPMDAMANLNKEEAMEEALSHTNQYSPFKVSENEVNKEVKKTSNKSAYLFIGIIFVIMLLFIIFLPQISKLFGWI